MTASDYGGDEIIAVQGLCKSYQHKLVVDHIDLTVRRGEIYGFLGPNGSGKTTTIRMICGLVTPDSGQGQCLGHNILTESDRIKHSVGYMTQNFSLYKQLSVYENLDFVARIYRLPQRQQRVAAALDRLGIDKSRQRQLAGQLSGGWKQRLALAAAILHQPKLLLLDEPTAGVDPKARRDFWQQIHELSAEGITTLVSTHYMDEAERCHRLAYLSYGKLLVHGSRQEVINHADIQTWEVSGSQLTQLGQRLHNELGWAQTTAFGQCLHLSAPSSLNLEQLLLPYRQDRSHHWKQIDPGLEDVFIYLMQQQSQEV